MQLFNYFKKKKYKKLVAQAEQLVFEKKYKEAIKIFEQAFDIIINVNDFIKVACIYIDLKEYDKGIQMFKYILEQSEENGYDIPGVCDVYFGLGVAYDCMNQKDLAIENYELAIENEISAQECYYFLACLYDELDLSIDDPKTIRALELYEKAVEMDNEYLFAYVNLGAMYAKFKEYDKCLEAFLRAKELDKDQDTNIDYNLGIAYANLGNFEKAEYYYLEELKTENPHISAYYNLGVLYKDNKQYDKAKYYYLKTIEKDKDEYYAWFNLACLYSIQNDYENALECFIYLKYKMKHLKKAIEEDEELAGFRSSEYMKKLEEF